MPYAAPSSPVYASIKSARPVCQSQVATTHTHPTLTLRAAVARLRLRGAAPATPPQPLLLQGAHIAVLRPTPELLGPLLDLRRQLPLRPIRLPERLEPPEPRVRARPRPDLAPPPQPHEMLRDEEGGAAREPCVGGKVGLGRGPEEVGVVPVRERRPRDPLCGVLAVERERRGGVRAREDLLGHAGNTTASDCDCGRSCSCCGFPGVRGDCSGTGKDHLDELDRLVEPLLRLTPAAVPTRNRSRAARLVSVRPGSPAFSDEGKGGGGFTHLIASSSMFAASPRCTCLQIDSVGVCATWWAMRM